jgi:hypothetical protein
MKVNIARFSRNQHASGQGDGRVPLRLAQKTRAAREPPLRLLAVSLLDSFNLR